MNKINKFQVVILLANKVDLASKKSTKIKFHSGSINKLATIKKMHNYINTNIRTSFYPKNVIRLIEK